MKPFRYQRARDVAAACASAAEPAAKFIAGGTNLVDLMKLQIETPAQLVDINALPLGGIEETAEQGLRIGALVTNSCATRRPPAATCFSAPVARTSTTPPSPATNARPARAARRWPASTA
jgi:CO/xanthine dehydrogenase FAD-binding subunit